MPKSVASQAAQFLQGNPGFQTPFKLAQLGI
jgi:hypothetical protein